MITKSSYSSSAATTLDYVMHDKDGQGTERVGFVERLNLGTRDATMEMEVTIAAAPLLQARQRKSMGGADRVMSSRPVRPIYHLSLSWHPEDKPTKAHMISAAKSVMKELGLEKHQCVIAEHRDQKHAHIHLVICLVHPVTGRMATLSHDRRKLSSWAHQYEAARQIRTLKRAEKMEKRMEIKKADPEIIADFEKLKADLGQKTWKVPEKGPLLEAEKLMPAKDPGKTRTPHQRPNTQRSAKQDLAKKHWVARLLRQKEMHDGRQRYAAKKADIRQKYRPALQALRPEKTPEKVYEVKPPNVRMPSWMQLAGALLKNPQTLPERLARKLSRAKPEIKKEAQEKFDRMRIPGWKALSEKPVKLAKRLPRAIAVDQIKKAERAELYDAAKAYGVEFKARHAEHQRQERAELKEMQSWAKEEQNAQEVQEALTSAVEQQASLGSEVEAHETTTPDDIMRAWQAAIDRDRAEALDRGI